MASLFVYKKTIYEINNNYKKEFALTEKEKKIHLKLSKLIEGMNIIITIILKNIKINNKKIRFDDIQSEYDKFEKIYLKVISNFGKIDVIIIIELLNKLEIEENISTKKMLELINNLINKLLNKSFIQQKVIDKLHSYKNNEKIEKLSTIKYINWLFK